VNISAAIVILCIFPTFYRCILSLEPLRWFLSANLLATSTMSENHSAENHPGSSEANQGAANWYSGWEDFSVPAETDPSPAAEGDFPDPDQQDWHPVDPPHALRVGDLEQTSTTPLPPTEEIPSPTPPIDLPNWSVRTMSPQAPVVDAALPQTPSSEPAEPPLDVTELISLIQELNQCNSALLDRVAQLEDTLEQTQARNQSVGNPGMQGVAVSPAPVPVVSADQVTQLLQELESTHQTSQRQQVLIETLSAQLNSSHERIVQLEGDYALMQQRLNEQQQKLLQSEQANRDLYIRLQRQQRYTLQFKAALERCLEVSTPPFDLPDMSAANASVSESMLAAMPAAPLTPKVRQIQPWASGPEGNLPPKLDVLRGQPLPTPSPSIPKATVNGEPAVPAVNVPPVPTSQPTPLNEGEPALDPDLQTSSNALQAAAAELKSVLANLLQPKAEAETAGEADVWRDLAKLADVSPDDVARASQTEEVNQFLAPPLPGETAVPKPHLSMPSEVFQAKASPQGIPNFVPGETGTQGDGTPPSPVVYPFRPLKKLESLAAIDLPSFPRSST